MKHEGKPCCTVGKGSFVNYKGLACPNLPVDVSLATHVFMLSVCATR